jgi:DoxX-like family
MSLLYALVFISSLSFMGYGIAYFYSKKMKGEFKRFGLAKVGALTAFFEILGALGLLIGLKINSILLVSAGGLAVLMLLGVAVRIKVSDTLLVTLPALFFMILNAYIFYLSLHR